MLICFSLSFNRFYFYTLSLKQFYTASQQVKVYVFNAGGAGDTGSLPGSGRSPGGQPTPVFLLKNPMDKGPW